MVPNQMIKFKQYITESITLKACPYGTNFPECTNKKWHEVKSKSRDFIYHWATGLEHEGKLYMVKLADNGDLSFYALSEAMTDDDFKDTDAFYAARQDKATMERVPGAKVLQLFSKVAYIALQGARHVKLQQIQFSGANSALDKVYALIAKNKAFLAELEKQGWYLKYAGYDIIFSIHKPKPPKPEKKSKLKVSIFDEDGDED